jgi:hypothetical protein
LFDRIILPQITTERNVEIIKDYYLYKPSINVAGIAPDVFGLKVDEVTIPFVKFDGKWTAVEGAPQIEVKTFKAKDQMVSLRNQDYDSQFLVLADLRLRIDYLVPFFDSALLNATVAHEMVMYDEAFIVNDPSGKITKISEIDFSNDQIGTIDLITVTNGTDFMNQASRCSGGIGPRRMKEIRLRKVRLNANTGFKLSDFASISPRINSIYEFNIDWYSRTNTNATKTLYVDFSASNLDNIEISAFNASSVVIKAIADGCVFNDYSLENGKQYIVEFATLERDGNNGVEYFMQKQCTRHLTNHTTELIEHLRRIINEV